MTKHHDVERHLHALKEINHIMGSMKTLALLETRKLTRFLATQQQVVQGIEALAADFRSFYPLSPLAAETAKQVYLLLGSERGFCGDFNETLLNALNQLLEQDGVNEPLLLGVGRKLCLKLEDTPRTVALLDGPSVAEEVEDILGQLVDALNRIQVQHGAFLLTVLHHTEETGAIQIDRLLPPFQETAPSPAFGYPPMLNMPPQAFFSELVDQYLFAALYALLYTSLMAENRRRMQHLEGAIRRLEERTSELTLKRNALRQEEITEEIEVILLSARAVQQNPPLR